MTTAIDEGYAEIESRIAALKKLADAFEKELKRL
jgi:hypothetical protein